MTCWRGECQRGCYYPDACNEPDALDSLPIAALLHSRLTSWFGDDRQSFLVSDLVPVVAQIVAEFQHNALEMARKADIAERRAEEAEHHVEQLRDARDAVEAGNRGLIATCEAAGAKIQALEAAIAAGCAVADRHEHMARVEHLRRCPICNRRFTHAQDCDHDWLDRPESDTRECLICGTEANG
jgi:hypothetical protein